MRVSEIRVKRVRVNQELGVITYNFGKLHKMAMFLSFKKTHFTLGHFKRDKAKVI